MLTSRDDALQFRVIEKESITENQHTCLNMNFERYWPHTRLEVEQSNFTNPQPVSQITTYTGKNEHYPHKRTERTIHVNKP